MNELDLFVAAIEITDPVKRAEFLDRECASNLQIRQRIEALLSGNQVSRHPLDVPPVGELGDGTQAHAPQSLTSDSPPAEHAGAVVAGKYTLVEVIGEGGMGSVWRAKQTEPVKRFVAVKLIKAGMDSKQVLARFEAERQALALMDHPNIAKVLDGGLHEHRPYFVMELVKGVPITDYCDKCKLTPKERLELFVPVCQAIQHAHQKGIIHRDIKPSNVLIALYDDKPVVKVIDFGVAKATGGTLTEWTIDTGFGGVVGTPQYMSPEQATFNNLDIDTRSDVYALGVLLYELLTGSPPFSKRDLETKGLLEMLRVVREEEPPRPSTKLSTADALPTLSANRGTEPKKLTGLLRNELDWIVMKALEKDRTRRYETANGFAADVSRYLSGEAVLAHPPSTAYRLKKFVRRNRGQVMAAGFVVLALVVGVAGTIWQAVRAEAARRDEATHRQVAEENEAKAVAAAAAEKMAKGQAEKRLAQIERSNVVLTAVFEDLDIRKIKEVGEPLEAVLAQRLVKAAGQLEGESVGEPLVVARLQDRLGASLVSLGYPNEAIGLHIKARATHTALLGATVPDTQNSMNNLALAYKVAGKLDLALPLFEETLTLGRATLGAEHPGTLSCMNNLAATYLDARKLDLALPLLDETVKLRKATLGVGHPDTITSMSNLAIAYQDARKLDLALPLFEETLKLRKAIVGDAHHDTLNSMNNLAGAYKDAGKLDLALPLIQDTLKLLKRKPGTEHPHTLTVMNNLAVLYSRQSRLDASIPLFEEALTLREKKLGRPHPDTLLTLANLGVDYNRAGRAAEAIPLLEEAYAAGKKHPLLRGVGPTLLDAYVKDRRPMAPVKLLLVEMLEDARKQQPKDSTQLAGLLAQFGGTLMEMKGFTEAESLLRECLAIRENTQPDAWTTFNTQSMLGGALLGQKKYADAEPLLVKGYEGLKAREKSIPPQGKIRLPEALDRLIEFYTATNKPDEAKKWRAERAKYSAPVEKAPMPREVK